MIINKIYHPGPIYKKPSFGMKEFKKAMDKEQVDKFVSQYAKKDQSYLRGIITRVENLLKDGLITIQIYDSQVRTAVQKIKWG